MLTCPTPLTADAAAGFGSCRHLGGRDLARIRDTRAGVAFISFNPNAGTSFETFFNIYPPPDDVRFIGIQEIKVTAANADEYRHRLARIGWDALIITSNGSFNSASADVALVARDGWSVKPLGLCDVGFDLPTSAHFGFGLSKGIFEQGLIIVVVYLVDSVGLNNLALLHSFQGVLYAFRKPYVTMADWNVPPDVLAESGWLQAIGWIISAPDRPTCLVNGSARVYDFAVHSHRWSSAQKAHLFETWAASPYTAVRFDTVSSQIPIEISVFRRPRAYPVAAPFGPWPDNVEPNYAYKHVSPADNVTSDQITDVARDCCSRVETELAFKYAADASEDSPFRGRSGEFRVVKNTLSTSLRGPVGLGLPLKNYYSVCVFAWQLFSSSAQLCWVERDGFSVGTHPRMYSLSRLRTTHCHLPSKQTKKKRSRELFRDRRQACAAPISGSPDCHAVC